MSDHYDLLICLMVLLQEVPKHYQGKLEVLGMGNLEVIIYLRLFHLMPHCAIMAQECCQVDITFIPIRIV